MHEDRPGVFYIGGTVDPATGERGDPLLYQADDLVTHGVIVGMTGSGKTGLGISVLEESLRSGIPCLIIDPKGDMGNLGLIFPEFRPADFAPWIDASEASRRGVSVDELAATTAETWREGLASWGIEPGRMRQVKESTRLTIYTPGSTAGVPLDILGSLAAPPLSWDTHAEELRDEIEGFVSSLLVLADIKADPVSSPEHILLSTIIEYEWRHGRDLDLARLVGLVPEPPVRKLGVFELEAFYPGKDRTQLAHKLNGLLASPSFSTWLEGMPLDIERMLMGGDGANAAVVYLAHLSDSQRQFVVTLLLSKLITWMRRQSGTSNLRLLVYMDEVFGFAPPVAEPPAKKQILTIFKQARAYGVGMLLSTQNPVDLDYKAIANAGTWLIGRLQTENDKRRVLEGLRDAGGATDVGAVDALVSNLDKRQFILRQAGRSTPIVFGTRWAMSYLAGPIDRSRIGEVGSATGSPPGPDGGGTGSARPQPELSDDTVPVVPPVASTVEVFNLDPAAPWADEVGAVPLGTTFKAVAVATVRLLYDDRPAGVEHREDYEAVIDPLTPRFDPANVIPVDHDDRDFRPGPPPEGVFQLADGPIAEASFWRDLGSGLREHLVRDRTITIWKNSELKLYSRVDEPEEEFRERCRRAAEEAADAAVVDLKKRYQTRIDRLQAAISRSDRRVAELGANYEARRQQEVVSGVGDVLGSLLGGRSKATALKSASTRRSMTQRARATLDSAVDKLTAEQQELEALERELEDELMAVVGAWEDKAEVIESMDIPLEANDIDIAEIRLVWVPVG